jgi:hypothetical protein
VTPQVISVSACEVGASAIYDTKSDAINAALVMVVESTNFFRIGSIV